MRYEYSRSDILCKLYCKLLIIVSRMPRLKKLCRKYFIFIFKKVNVKNIVKLLREHTFIPSDLNYSFYLCLTCVHLETCCRPHFDLLKKTDKLLRELKHLDSQKW